MDADRFSSRRERRLWLWTVVAIAGVYSTLGLASILPEALYSQGVAAAAFLGAMALVGVVVLTEGLRVRPAGIEIGIGVGIAVVYGMVLFRMAIPERSHLIEYGVVAVLLYEALRERADNGRGVPAPWLLAIGGTTVVGVIDELIQIALPPRVFDPVDMLFNAMAAAAAVVAVVLLRWVRPRVKR